MGVVAASLVLTACPPATGSAFPSTCTRDYAQTVCVYKNAGFDVARMYRFSGDDWNYTNNDYLVDGRNGTNALDWVHDSVTGVANNTDWWVVFFPDVVNPGPGGYGVYVGETVPACVAPHQSIPDLNDFNGGIWGIGGPNDSIDAHLQYSKSGVQNMHFECQYYVGEDGRIQHQITTGM